MRHTPSNARCQPHRWRQTAGARGCGAHGPAWAAPPILWSARREDGGRALLAEGAAAVPYATSAAVAEAWGLSVGLGLVARAGAGVGCRSLEIYGDSLAVICLGAGAGRVRGPLVWRLVSDPLARCLGLGWDIRWHAVRRRFGAGISRAIIGPCWCWRHSRNSSQIA